MGVKALLVYPEMPPTYWSMRYALPFLGRKAAYPPLGLITVAALLPPDWDLRLLDMNVEPLRQRDVEAADLVLTSAMLVQRPSFQRVIALCRACHRPLVAGGPYPTSCPEQMEGVDHLVLGEAEVNLPPFLEDLRRGHPRHCYRDPARPDITRTPPPRFELLDRKRYAAAALQFSRGCPHHCEFCDIVELFGHRPRTKTPAQFLEEMDRLYACGWRGSLFVVDDNFIGNRIQVRRLLPEIARWQARHRHPFSLHTEASLDLASDEALMDEMVQAGFNMVFVGIETPDAATLAAIGKCQNTRSDLMASVRAIQRKGLEVAGGFIVGFDEDREDIFDRQIRFIQESGIPMAMVGLLTALPRTRLHARLAAEGRILGVSGGGGNAHDLALNFLPRMDADRLRAGYKRVLKQVYQPSHYFSRCLDLIRRLKPQPSSCRRIRILELRAFLHSLVRQSLTRYAFSYWAYLLKALSRRPRMAPEIVAMAVKGHHFFIITHSLFQLERFKDGLELLRRDLEARVLEPHREGLEAYRSRLLQRARVRCARLRPDFRDSAIKALEEFQVATKLILAQAWPASTSRGPGITC